MLFAVACCVVLLFLGRDDLSLKSVAGIVVFLVASCSAIAVLRLHPIIVIVPVVAVDVYLTLKIFGSDIRIR
jgi:hypothetical protein